MLGGLVGGDKTVSMAEALFVNPLLFVTSTM
jgi:hypothetical protein